jgi:homoserine dehydrogenase
MRVAREIRAGSPERVSPFAHPRLGAYKPIPITTQKLPYYLRFRVRDRPGIIAALSSILAEGHISLDAVLQLPTEDKEHLPFVITVEPTTEKALRGAISAMNELDFMTEPALVMPMEKGL